MTKTREDYALVYFRKESFSDISKVTFLKFLNWWADLRIFFFPELKLDCPEVFYKKGFYKHFAKFTGKQLFHSLFFNKFAGLTLSRSENCLEMY